MRGLGRVVFLLIGAGLSSALTGELAQGFDASAAGPRFYPLGGGRWRAVLPVSAGPGQTVPTDSVKACYPQVLPNWTGNVKFQNSNYEKNSGDLYFRGGNAASHDRRQAWVKIDLSTIPDNATINSAYLAYYCYQIDEMPTTDITLLVTDPVTASASTIYNEVLSGTQVAGVYAHGEGWQYRELNSNGIAAVQSRLSTDWVALGVREQERNNKAWGYAYGFGGGPGGQYRPYLSLDFSLPAAVDVSMEDVVSPAGTVIPGSTVYPSGVWRNRQLQSVNFTAYFFLIDRLGTRRYSQAIQVNGLGAARDTLLVFPVTPPLDDTGRWVARCSTFAAGDVDPMNDIREEWFLVRDPGQGLPGEVDVAVLGIQEPVGWVDTGTVLTPTARWKNNGVRTAFFSAFLFLIDPAGDRVYWESQTVSNLDAGAETLLVFPEFSVAHLVGHWQVFCSTAASLDTIPANDTLLRQFNVYAGTPPWVPGWHEVRPMPPEPSLKGVKDGGWLVYDPSYSRLFAAKGNKAADFYTYCPAGDSWHLLRLWPEGREQKAPYRGAAAVSDGSGHVYATKGNNSLGFWRYDVDGDSWHQLPDVLLGSSGKKVKGGTDLVYVNRGAAGYIYLLKGYKTEFQRFDIATETWEELQSAPEAGRPKWDKGSWLVYDGSRYIYAHKAKYHQLWRFDEITSQWDTATLHAMPLVSRTGKTKKSKDGGCGTWDNGYIWGLKGGNTCEFYRYDVAGDSWLEKDTMPSVGSTARKKRVKAGGDIVTFRENFLFALKGNKTRELWYYYEPPIPEQAGSEGAVAAGTLVRPGRVWLEPNPVVNGQAWLRWTSPVLMPGLVRLYDVTGRQVFEQSFARGASNTRLDLSRLAKGAYLCVVSQSLEQTVHKVVLR
jgi:hypothetical protein